MGYGNLGKSLEELIINQNKLSLVKIFSRRENLKSPYNSSFDNLKNLASYKNAIDILFLCVGSNKDIENVSFDAIKNFNIIDCFDTHDKLKDYLFSLNIFAKYNDKVALSAFGWDPGIMSLIRTLFDGINISNKAQTFWGKGVSQGHTNAIKQLVGVEDALQYTIPNKKILKQCKSAKTTKVDNNKKHKRLCFVSVLKDVDKNKIANEIKSMPNYFKGQNTKIKFVSLNKINKLKKKMKHKGYIVSNNLFPTKNKLEFSLEIESNPNFTASIMLMGVNVVVKLIEEKSFGAYSILDVPIYYLSNLSRAEIYSKSL